MTPAEQSIMVAMEHIGAGRHKKAHEICSKVLEEQPMHAPALHIMGLVYFKQRKLDEAIEHISRAVQLEMKNPLYLGNLGEIQRRAGKPKEALISFERALLLMPEFLKAHLGLANTLRDLGRIEEAVARFRLALAIDPRFAPAYHYLGVTFLTEERVRDALPLLRKAVGLNPDYMEAWLSLGSALESDEQTDEALKIFRKILEREPNNILVHNNLGNILKNQGKIDESIEHYRQALAINPDQASAYYNLSRAKVGSDDAAELKRMEELLEQPRLNSDQKSSIHFALGKIYDDLGNYDKAFEHFYLGNEMDTRGQPFRPRVHSMVVDRVISVFSKEFFANRRGMGSESHQPVFIVGMPRSGTTLVEQTLASHPEVYGAGELNHIGHLVASIPDLQGRLAGYPDSAMLVDAVTACKLGDDYVSRIRTVGGDAKRITDKMPGNFLNLGFISLFFSNARIIHCSRESMDSSLSCYFQHFTQIMPFSKKLEFLGSYQKDYLRLMEHWRRVLPLQMMEVNYKDMVADHEGMTRKILEFLDLDWDDSCLKFHKTERSVKTASNWQVRQPIYTGSVDRWRHYEKHIGPLVTALGLTDDDMARKRREFEEWEKRVNPPEALEKPEAVGKK
ncbi:MAG: tetratricopeptide repeat protein [Magnetococcales bacterium]|nr:tetratricopeptide repeat protein [Magnetococcales bacterium]